MRSVFTRIPVLVLTSGLLLLAGCVSSTYFPYVGRQKEWPTSEGCLVQNNLKLPIYVGLPERPYRVLGAMVISSKYNTDYAAVERALWRHADALVFLSANSVYVGTFNFATASGSSYGNNTWASGSSSSVPIYYNRNTYVFIQFQPTNQPVATGIHAIQ